MNKDLLDILVCPKSKKKLEMADPEVIKKINKKIEAGNCKDISGEIVKEPVAEGLFQPEDGVFFQIRNGIPLLIYENGILI